MARVHAAAVLAGRPGLVKAYPHSLLEALAAGRPVVVSGGNPMAAYVRDTGCGRVLARLDATELVTAIGALRRDYETYRARAAAGGPAGLLSGGFRRRAPEALPGARLTRGHRGRPPLRGAQARAARALVTA